MLLDGLAAAAAGVLTGLGVGGGGLLMVYMTTWGGLEQLMAQGINLLYYLPTAGAALSTHVRERTVDWKTALPAIVGGLISAGLGACISHFVDAALLQKLFGVLLLYVGVSELFAK